MPIAFQCHMEQISLMTRSFKMAGVGLTIGLLLGHHLLADSPQGLLAYYPL
ncbi:MAG: hypothetical protein QOD03_347, partial [Verrucomicrobiota bacterium]